VNQRATDIMAELEKSSGQAIDVNPQAVQQIALFPGDEPSLDELGKLDMNSLSPN